MRLSAIACKPVAFSSGITLAKSTERGGINLRLYRVPRASSRSLAVGLTGILSVIYFPLQIVALSLLCGKIIGCRNDGSARNSCGTNVVSIFHTVPNFEVCMHAQENRALLEDSMSLSLCRIASSGRALCTGLLVMLTVCLVSLTALAQQEATPKVEIFTGYQWLHPGGNVPAPFQSPTNPVAFKLPDMSGGWGASFTYNFDQHWGLEADYGGSWNKFAMESTGSIGPRFIWRTEGVNFFAHTLLSLNRLTVNHLDSSNGIGAVLGGGMDIPVWRRLTIRLFEADFVWAHHNFANQVSPAFSDLQHPALNGARLRTGLVWNFGYPSTAAPAASCSVQPSEVMVGEPVTATATGSNFNPKHTLNYAWSSTGGRITGKDNTASIDTNGLSGGSYTVTARVSDPRMKKGGEASCSSNFTVKEPPKNPPTMSCAADPTSVQAGAASTISCNCTSPDNVPVTVSAWNASGGSLSGSGGTATLDTTGASAGPITVSATCTDSRGLNTQATALVTVENPPTVSPEVQRLETRLALHSIYFPTAQPPVQKPDGGLLASQQQTPPFAG